MEIINTKEIERDVGFKPIPMNHCPECHKEMNLVKGKLKCFKCGIEVELQE